MFIEVPQLHETCPALKNVWLRAWTRDYFCQTLHLKCLVVFRIRLSRELLSNLYSVLTPCTKSDTFRILAYSELCFFRYMQAYSSIFRIIKDTLHWLRQIFSSILNDAHMEELVLHIIHYKSSLN